MRLMWEDAAAQCERQHYLDLSSGSYGRGEGGLSSTCLILLSALGCGWDWMLKFIFCLDFLAMADCNIDL